MKRLMVGVVAVLLFTGNAGAQTRRNAVGRPDAVTPAAGDALAGLTSAQRSDFFDGLADFRSIETVRRRVIASPPPAAAADAQ